MRAIVSEVVLMSLLTVVVCRTALAQGAWTWDQVRSRFEQSNSALQADKLSVDESRADEITAFLRPNPSLTLSVDGTQIAPNHGVWQPFRGTFESPGISYLHERRHKRELRLESAKKGTLIAESNHADLKRTLLFNLRSAFVSTLQAKAVLQLAKDNLGYWDHLLAISRTRFDAGDIAQIRKALLDLPAIEVKTIEDTPHRVAFIAHAVLIGWLNDKELLIVENRLLVAYNVGSNARRKSTIRVEESARAFLR